MSESHLKELLAELHEELEAAEDLSDDQAADLRAAIDEIHAVLRRKGKEKPGSMAETFRNAADRLEDSHPRLTHAVGRVADALSQIGI